VAASAPLAYRLVGRRALLWCAIAPLAAFVWLAARAGRVTDGHPDRESFEWIPQLGVDVAVRLDAFALLMALLVTGIGVLVFVYAYAYFDGHEEPALTSFTAWLTLFAGSMLGLVLADDVFILFVFWELTSVTSFFLIGFHHEQGSVRGAARQAFLVTSMGGLALLGGLVMIAQAAGTTSLSEILAAPPATDGVVIAGLMLVLVGAFTKSAQVPFHFWLPSAMVAPTPVSGYLHSATMVKAGVYIVARFAPAFAAVGPWRPVVLTVGLATMVVGGWRALFAHDLKQLLALSTISQLGFLVVLFGAGSPELAEAACLMLLAHAIAKAALFMVVGVIDRQAQTRDLRALTGLGRRLPLLAVVATVVAASMAGVGPVIGFIGKEHVFDGLLDSNFPGTSAVLAVVVIGSCLTFAYALRFLWGAFATKSTAEAGRHAVGPDVPRPTAAFVLPAALLAACSLAFGMAPALVTRLAKQAARAVQPDAVVSALSVIPHLGAAFVLSLLVVAVGTAVFTLRRPLERFHEDAPALLTGERGYELAIRGLNRVADRVTGIVQHGSLPVYVGVVLLTFLALPGTVLFARTSLPDELTLADSPMQAAVGALVLGAAIATAVAHRRFAAVLSLGAAGYGVALLWVLQGAPDLAVTQLLVETVSVVVFVLVLRRLPDRFQPPRRGQLARIAVAGLVGVMMTMFVLVAGGARVAPPVSDELVSRSLDEGGGRNVVNVIIVDFRGYDTLGEITVLVVAALGITSLVLAGRAPRKVARTGAEREADR